VIVIYLISPLLWILACNWILDAYPLRTIVRALKVTCLLSSLSVGLFYYLFFTAGPEAVLFFIEEPNIDTTNQGYIGATMYVFGSLIFLVGGLVASADLRRDGVLGYALLLTALVVAFVAGRSALLLAVFIGAGIHLLKVLISTSPAQLAQLPASAMRIAVIVGVLLLGLVQAGLELELLVVPLLEKVASAGGEGRMQQFHALLEGLMDHHGLGAGHGIGVAYTVSDDHPWRYEMVWLASAYRTGLLGAAVYALPFVWVLVSATRQLFARRLNPDELFLASGFLCAFIASNTNPYVEAFVFQWMYVLPMAYFLKRDQRQNRPTSAKARAPHLLRETSLES
jgi:hypothetical protein